MAARHVPALESGDYRTCRGIFYYNNFVCELGKKIVKAMHKRKSLESHFFVPRYLFQSYQPRIYIPGKKKITYPDPLKRSFEPLINKLSPVWSRSYLNHTSLYNLSINIAKTVIWN